MGGQEMKARIRGTNIEVDVQPFYDETGYFSGFKDGYEYYRAADLVFPDNQDWDKTDWSSFRREAAKDILVGMVANGELFYAYHEKEDTAVKQAIQIADELIRQLKM